MVMAMVVVMMMMGIPRIGRSPAWCRRGWPSTRTMSDSENSVQEPGVEEEHVINRCGTRGGGGLQAYQNGVETDHSWSLHLLCSSFAIDDEPMSREELERLCRMHLEDKQKKYICL
jgi:hypothetical protein